MVRGRGGRALRGGVHKEHFAGKDEGKAGDCGQFAAVSGTGVVAGVLY